MAQCTGPWEVLLTDSLCRSRQKAEDLAAAAEGRAEVVDLEALLSGGHVCG